MAHQFGRAATLLLFVCFVFLGQLNFTQEPKQQRMPKAVED